MNDKEVSELYTKLFTALESGRQVVNDKEVSELYTKLFTALESFSEERTERHKSLLALDALEAEKLKLTIRKLELEVDALKEQKS